MAEVRFAGLGIFSLRRFSINRGVGRRWSKLEPELIDSIAHAPTKVGQGCAHIIQRANKGA